VTCAHRDFVIVKLTHEVAKVFDVHVDPPMATSAAVANVSALLQIGGRILLGFLVIALCEPASTISTGACNRTIIPIKVVITVH
jgi:hypothetical protein